ncbi:methyltransferase [Vulcanibacillus modesticaldus]|uniref:Methyltransferase n=1 Tax=Vulcanibacillus modesticaldus TaxID=337097 RepID=A0A1D2YX85_9BACI|nr:methyltransferase domain-containing protein [Vulcanibacillus modesticaldus]OEG00243.1 methyltransferase [Vulcanibacillus modesticaldus]
MKHKFDPQKMKQRIKERKKILPPEETLRKLHLRKGDIMADVGCGFGYFTFPASKIVGEDGKVYALDISQQMLDEVIEGIETNDINNVEIIKVAEDDLKLDDETITYVLLSTVLHEVDDAVYYLNEIKRILKSEGKIAIIDWEKKQSSYGPPVEDRLDKNEVRELLVQTGYKIIEQFDIGTDYYAIVAEK